MLPGFKEITRIKITTRKEEPNMKNVKICLDTIEKVKGFVNAITPLDGDFDLVSDRYVVDAKSIMGIFSLDLGKTLQLNIHCDQVAEKVMPLLQPYIVG